MIKITNLTQVYPSGKGIFDVEFEVKKGEVFGYLGPNGAGKTTTIRNILGFSNASKGEVTINDLNTRSHSAELQAIIGYLPGEIAFFDNMTGMEFLKFLVQMRNMKDTTRMHTLIERFELDAKGRIKKMSKGMKQKLGIVAAFMHDPEIIILDEPTSGLDPLMQSKFMELLEEEKKKGNTILMSSHIFEEVERVCDRVGIIKDGKIVTVESIATLSELKDTLYTLVTTQDDEEILKASNIQYEKLDATHYIITVNKNYELVFETLAKCHVKSFESKHQSLEDLFMGYYGKEQ
jgi:ABC-2 type transport system ATP-binding protein